MHNKDIVSLDLGGGVQACEFCLKIQYRFLYNIYYSYYIDSYLGELTKIYLSSSFKSELTYIILIILDRLDTFF